MKSIALICGTVAMSTGGVDAVKMFNMSKLKNLATSLKKSISISKAKSLSDFPQFVKMGTIRSQLLPQGACQV